MLPIEISDDLFKQMITSLPEYQIRHQIFKSPRPDIGDLETIVSYKSDTVEHRIHSFWLPNKEELTALNFGNAIELTIWADHLYPVALSAWGNVHGL